ncbi:MAG: hypothetical protein IJ124_02275 [Clostridia bacterium]|nr:hypothetical protein [Clostridia bacterium]
MKRKKTATEERRSAADYYKLNLKAVDDLVTADKSNSPKVSPEELRKYRSGIRLSLPNWLKVVLIKAWFAGSVCFFFLWGLGNYVTDQLDKLFIVALALGVVTDLLTNNALRFLARTPGANDRWMMLSQKRYISLPLNILYAMLLMFCVVTTYNAINAAIIALTGVKDRIPLGVGPILFGVFTTAWDLLFLAMKRMLGRMLEDAKRTAG